MLKHFNSNKGNKLRKDATEYVANFIYACGNCSNSHSIIVVNQVYGDTMKYDQQKDRLLITSYTNEWSVAFKIIGLLNGIQGCTIVY